MWLEKLFSLKYTAFLISILIMLIGLAGLVMGITNLYHAVLTLVGLEDGRVGLLLIESIDKFLFSLVILILAAGIFKLFVGTKETFRNSLVLKDIDTFKELKVLLWETLLLTLTVWAALGFFNKTEDFGLEQMILPGSILLLAISLWLVKGKDKAGGKD